MGDRKVEPAPLVQLEKVSKRYDKEPQDAISQISMTVSPGDFTTIVGPSGAGKSTLLHLMGLLDSPTSGEVMVLGHSTTDLTPPQRAALRSQYLGFVFQFHYLLPDLTIFENILLPLLISRSPAQSRLRLRRWRWQDQNSPGSAADRRQLAQAVHSMLDLVGLSHKEAKYPHQLSGGERQRVAVARALIAKPRLVLADEPTGNLDSNSAQKVWDLLRSVTKMNTAALVVVTHNLELAEQAGRVITMVDGRITGKKESVRS